MPGRTGAILDLNRAAPGFSREEVKGKTIYDYPDPKHHAVVKQCCERVFRTGEAGECSVPGATAGPRKIFGLSLGPVRRKGQVVALTIIFGEAAARGRATAATE